MRHITQAGIDLIKKHEGLSLKAYLCPAGVMTIGYGHTDPTLTANSSLTKEAAEALFMSDISKFCLAVDPLITVKITDDQFSALVSLAYNIGIGAFKKSTLLKMLNSNEFALASEQFALWNKNKLPGLTKRRREEKALFTKDLPR